MNTKRIYGLGLAFLITAAVSCVKYKDFGETNVNPGGVTEPIFGALLANVQAGTIGAYGSTTMTRPGAYAQYFSETQYPSASLYDIPQIEFNTIYSGSLYDLQNIILKNPSNNMTQVARILKSYIFWTMTDRWGDIPYSQALKGDSIRTPVYDKQQDIYTGLLAELKGAVASFDASSLITGDISNYGGSVAKWKKLGNSLRLLISLQMSKKYPSGSGLAATEFKAALADAGGVIADNADNYQLDYPGGNLSSPWYNLYNGRKDWGESKTMTDLISSLGDKRQTAFAADVNGDATTIGVPYGLNRDKMVAWTDANPKWAYVLNDDLRKQEGSVVVIPAATIFLARAEAADRGWTTENAWTMLQNGVNQSHAQWGIAAPAASYFTQSSVAFSGAAGTAANIKQIALQRYLAGYPNGLEGWNLWRRTGFPVLTPAPDATNSGAGIPRRYTYGISEYTTNGANVKAAAAALSGGDKMDSKIWWDQ